MQVIKTIIAFSGLWIADAQLSQCKIGATGKDSPAEFELFSKYASSAYCPTLLEPFPDVPVCNGDTNGVCAGFDDATTLAGFPTMSFNIGGFIAKSKGPNPYIVVAFKGTESTAEWLINANKLLTDATEICSGCRMHSGFLGVFNLVKNVTKNLIEAERKIPNQENIRIIVTGHSLGGAVATIMATFLRGQGVPCDLYTYGSPKVGNSAFARFAESQGGFSARITNGKDFVPALPPTFLGLLPYEHVFPEYWYETPLTLQEARYGGDRNCCLSEGQCSVTQCTAGPIPLVKLVTCSISDHFTKAYADGFQTCEGLTGRQGATDGLDSPDEPTLEVLQAAVDELQKEISRVN